MPCIAVQSAQTEVTNEIMMMMISFTMDDDDAVQWFNVHLKADATVAIW